MPTDPIDILFVFTEVQVGFLGFSGLAGVVSRSSWKSIEVSIRFWVLLAMGFMGLLLSLLPPILTGFIENNSWIYFIGSLIGLGCWIFQTTVFSTKIMAAMKKGQFNKVPKSLYPLYQVPALLSLISFITGLFIWDYNNYIFLLGLLFFTLASVGNFICFLVANQKIEDEADGVKDI